MAKTILTKRQALLLTLLSKEKSIFDNFYFSGGTGLSEYYLHHRYSEDLDFFSFEEVNPISIQIIFKKIQKEAGIERIDYQESFNRNLFFLHFPQEIIKAEFSYYPSEQLQTPKTINGLKIDSLLDIAVNKVFTIYQKPRSRDFIDLYLILQNKKWTFGDLRKKARIKFDAHIDPLQLGQQLLKVTQLKDYPRMIISLEPEKWQDFFLNEAKKLKKEVLK